MPRDDEVVHEDEEEDLGTAMQNIPIPFNELDQLPIDSVHGFPDDVKEIIEDSNLFFEDTQVFDDLNHNKSFDDSKLFGNSINPPTVTRGRLCVPKPSRNKRGRPPKRQCFKNAASRFDSNFVDITEKSCSHCGTRKTPLWREGPRGASTLCNACGMRYRTGRLLPEYRPASSPDFIPNIHSNFHRKVMEIRRERNLPRTQ